MMNLKIHFIVLYLILMCACSSLCLNWTDITLDGNKWEVEMIKYGNDDCEQQNPKYSLAIDGNRILRCSNYVAEGFILKRNFLSNLYCLEAAYPNSCGIYLYYMNGTSYIQGESDSVNDIDKLDCIIQGCFYNRDKKSEHFMEMKVKRRSRMSGQWIVQNKCDLIKPKVVKALFSKCNIILTTIVWVMILILICVLYKTFTLLLKKCYRGFVPKEEIGLVRYEVQGSKRIVKFGAYASSNNTRKRKITLFGYSLCCIMLCAQACDKLIVAPTKHTECLDGKNCYISYLITVQFYATGQTLCMNTDMGMIKMTFRGITYSCNEVIEYYTPKGDLEIKERWNCDGNDCNDGERESLWNELSVSHKGGWFRGCWGWSKQCHILKFIFNNLEMCSVKRCKSVSRTVLINAELNKEKVDYIITGTRPYQIFPNISLLFNANLDEVPDQHFLQCGKRTYKVSSNALNVHDINRIGSIQCPTNSLNKDCSVNWNNFYKFNYDGELIRTVDINYRDQLMDVSMQEKTFKLNLNNFKNIEMNIISNVSLKYTTHDLNVGVSEVKLEGSCLIEDGVKATYKCAYEKSSLQFYCPDNIMFSLYCVRQGINEDVLSILLDTKEATLSCSVYDSLDHIGTMYISFNVSLPVIDLIKFDNNPVFVNKDNNISLLGSLWDMFLLNSKVTIPLTCILVIVIIHDGFKFLQ